MPYGLMFSISMSYDIRLHQATYFASVELGNASWRWSGGYWYVVLRRLAVQWVIITVCVVRPIHLSGGFRRGIRYIRRIMIICR